MGSPCCCRKRQPSAGLPSTRPAPGVSAATGVSLALGEPVVAFVLAIVILGEALGASAIVGLALVVGGVLGVTRVDLRGTAPSTPAPSAQRRRAEAARQRLAWSGGSRRLERTGRRP